MNTVYSSLTILFEEPFWVGIYEREINGRYEVSKTVFGAEPKDMEVYDFIIRNWARLRFSPPVKVEKSVEQHVNPKRMQRVINKQIDSKGIGTKAQQALKLQHEQNKLERKSVSREMRELRKEEQFNLKQEKRKEKHKGH